ncbi:MAG: hypothetical protein PWP23_2605 [Candidatus Sumerlaeota bacterium]|nr:hypothetical protein [Candidatus Sumerlaeota bacterium]
MSKQSEKAATTQALTAKQQAEVDRLSSAEIVRQFFGDLFVLLADHAAETDGIDEEELRHFLRKANERLVKDPNLDGLCHSDVRQGLAAAEHFLLVASTWLDPERCAEAQRSLATAMLLSRLKPV